MKKPFVLFPKDDFKAFKSELEAIANAGHLSSSAEHRLEVDIYHRSSQLALVYQDIE